MSLLLGSVCAQNHTDKVINQMISFHLIAIVPRLAFSKISLFDNRKIALCNIQ